MPELSPNDCPNCSVQLCNDPETFRYASMKCTSCGTALWAIRRPDGIFFFDSGDMETFQKHRAAFKAIDQERLQAGGWYEHETNRPLYELLVELCDFSLLGETLIRLTENATGINFGDIYKATDKQVVQELESGLRGLAVALFREHYPDDTCCAIDVNHREFTFTPRELSLDQNLEPWPIDFLLWNEYVVFACPDFSQGILCNPRNSQIVVFGKDFAHRFREAFPNRVTDAEDACV